MLDLDFQYSISLQNLKKLLNFNIFLSKLLIFFPLKLDFQLETFYF